MMIADDANDDCRMMLMMIADDANDDCRWCPCSSRGVMIQVARAMMSYGTPGSHGQPSDCRWWLRMMLMMPCRWWMMLMMIAIKMHDLSAGACVCACPWWASVHFLREVILKIPFPWWSGFVAWMITNDAKFYSRTWYCVKRRHSRTWFCANDDCTTELDFVLSDGYSRINRTFIITFLALVYKRGRGKLSTDCWQKTV